MENERLDFHLSSDDRPVNAYQTTKKPSSFEGIGNHLTGVKTPQAGSFTTKKRSSNIESIPYQSLLQPSDGMAQGELPQQNAAANSRQQRLHQLESRSTESPPK